jgi:CubicO group peptidase (beta-lactamase class C family)
MHQPRAASANRDQPGVGGADPAGLLAHGRLADRFRAEGFGGQLIQVIPELDLVLVITSDADQGRDDAADLVGAVIVSAVTGQP